LTIKPRISSKSSPDLLATVTYFLGKWATRAPAQRAQTIFGNRRQLPYDVDLLEAVKLAVLHEVRSEQGVPAPKKSNRFM
jgi:hypothetical protein